MKPPSLGARPCPASRLRGLHHSRGHLFAHRGGGRDASPCVVREVMSLSLLTIVSDIPGSRDLILPGQTGLLAPARDAKALSEAIRWRLTHPEERRAMGRQGREPIARDFSPAAYMGLFAHLFRSLASS